ncbi:MAG: ATP-dependent helicase [Candidatus Limnocylindrales bacterium]
MAFPSAIALRLGRLSLDQRAAATAPPGPVLCVAPAGSGKTTTLVARIAWLIASGTPATSITAITFNRRAAAELEARLDEELARSEVASGSVRVRTFHALGLEVLREAGRPTGPIADRPAVLRSLAPRASPAEISNLDGAVSRLKVELGVTAAVVARDPQAGPIARAFVAYEQANVSSGRIDFDDLVLGAIRALEQDTALLARWRARCVELLVDEVQDVDRTQLRLALLLAAPANRIFLVGDDDQSIYGWRLADVRRVLALDTRLPGLRRVHLVTNYRCPRPVVERSARLVAHNRERFAKTIRAGPDASGRLVLAPDGGEDDERIGRAIERWPQDGSTRAVLARTNAELVPAAVAAIERNLPFRAGDLHLPLDDPLLDRALGDLEAAARLEPGVALLVLIGRLRDSDPAGRSTFATLLGCAPRFADPASLANALRDRRRRSGQLRQDDAPFSLATVHATKGLEFDHVIVLHDADRFPSHRAIDEAADPHRALEEERRLAYVAWTRARRSLTLLYDPAAPSRFLLEAFDRRELGP